LLQETSTQILQKPLHQRLYDKDNVLTPSEDGVGFMNPSWWDGFCSGAKIVTAVGVGKVGRSDSGAV